MICWLIMSSLSNNILTIGVLDFVISYVVHVIYVI